MLESHSCLLAIGINISVNCLKLLVSDHSESPDKTTHKELI